MDRTALAQWIGAALLVAIGIAHSYLGEKELLRPLFAQRGWRLPRVPREPAQRILRFVWHLTTLAWFALAAVLVGASPTVAFAATCLGSAALILATVPGHVAWPPFLAAGFLALGAADALAPWLLWAAVGLGVAVAAVAAAFHVAWALGSRRGAANVIPQRPDGTEPTFRPGPAATAAVAILLTVFAALAIAVAMGASAPWASWLLIAGLAVLLVRVMGDGRWVGVTKSVRSTGFAIADDRYWTPAVAILATSAAAALALG